MIAAGAVPGAALAHEGNPDYRSEITSTPPGVEAQMLNYDDSIELRVDAGHEVVVEGYEGEPYLRFLADGTVEVNRNSPAAYLNEDRYADVEVPGERRRRGRARVAAGRPSRAATPGTTIASTTWRRRRRARSPTSRRRRRSSTGELPVEVDGSRSELAGTLYWVGTGGGASPALIAALAAAVLAELRVRRLADPTPERRRSARPTSGGPEAW